MKWFKIMPIAISESGKQFEQKPLFAYAASKQEAITSVHAYGLPYCTHEPDAVECNPTLEEVDYKRRAFAEATTEELHTQLKARGWVVSLTK